MADPFIGEIRLFPFGTVPRGWMQCNGQTLPVAQNAALFALLSNRFGGDGKTTFQLPDLRGRVIVSQGTNASKTITYPMAQAGGQESVTLATATIPAHTHSFNGTTAPATTNTPKGALLAEASSGALLYSTNMTSLQPLTPASIDQNTGSGGHENRQPFLALNFCIAIVGIYPSHQ
jgi:microcystin-dependent protein